MYDELCSVDCKDVITFLITEVWQYKELWMQVIIYATVEHSEYDVLVFITFF